MLRDCQCVSTLGFEKRTLGQVPTLPATEQIALRQQPHASAGSLALGGQLAASAMADMDLVITSQ
jgi:hypothetical protein